VKVRAAPVAASLSVRDRDSERGRGGKSTPVDQNVDITYFFDAMRLMMGLSRVYGARSPRCASISKKQKIGTVLILGENNSLHTPKCCACVDGP
jgi:hypothetical protein